MAFSHSCRILWFASVIFVILPHFNLGLLSDYKICGDSGCESFMSRAQATRDHRGKDCRFLSFRQGDTILVYHKLTGKREDLWAGTIGKQFGYFPKDAVQEEQVYAAAEKVVETQKSDFICMDEHGYPIDSSHLDNSDEDGDNDQNIQNQESETVQTIVHTDDSSAEYPSASIDSASESPDQPDATSREKDKNQKSGPTTSATREDTHETPAALGEQGGSPSSSWLGSSVTGWLGMGKDEQSDNTPEREEPQEEVSLTSSVTGWLGFGGEKKLDDTVNSREEDKEVAASFTSTMTGWLGLGDKKEADHATKEQHEERETDDASEPKETFRSRRMSLDLEGSQLQEEEKEVGTLGWLGKGLTSTLGFGATNLETDPIKEKQEKPPSSSWLDIGVGDILGFGKSESEIDKSSRNNIKETEKDSMLGEATPSDQVDISESQPVQEDQKKTKPDIQRLEENVGMETSTEIGDNTFSSSSSANTNESNVEEHVVDNFSPLESASVTLTLEEDVHNDSIAVSDASESKSPPVDAAATVDWENSSPQTTSEENLQPLDETPPMTDEAGSAEATEGQQLPKSTGNGSGSNNRELEVEENKSASDDRDIITQPDADLGSDLYSMESKGQYLENTDRAEHVEDDGAKIIKQVEREESTMVGLELGGNSYSHEKTNVERDKRHLDIYPTLTESDEISQDEGSRGQSQSSSSSDTHKEENEPTHSEEDSVTAHSVKTDILDTVVTTEDSKNERESYNTGVQNRDVHSASGPSLYVNPPKDQMLVINSKDPEPGSPENEEVIALKEKQEEFEEKSEVKDGDGQERVEERKQKEDKIKEEEMQEEVHELQKTEKQEDVKKVKEEEKQGEMGDEGGNPDGKEELREDIQEEGDDVQEEMRQEERGEGEENTKLEVKELKEEEKEGDEEMVEVEGANEGEKQDGQGESEKRENEQEAASVEEEKQDEVESVEEEKELMEVKEEEKQDRTKEFQVEEKEAEVEEFRKGKEETEQQDEERQQTIAGSKEEEEEREKQILKSKEEEKQEKLNDLNDSKEKGKDTTVQVPHLETQKTNVHDIFEPELEISEETHDDNTKTEENKREEEQVKHVDEELSDEEEEESPKCSNKPCHQAPEDEPAGVRNEKPRSTDDSMIQQNKQVLESETMSSEGTETDRLREEEPDEASDDSDEGEETAIKLNATGNENTYSNNVNIADHKVLKVEQIGAAPHTDNDQRPAGESGPSGHTGTSLGETWETKEHHHKAENDTVGQGPVGSGANNRVKVENSSGGAFGLFENAFSFFSQTPASKTKEPTASTPSVDTNTAEASTPQASLPVEQESDSTQFKPNSNQVPVQGNHKHSPVSISTQQHRQPPPVSAPSPSPETKSLSKYYKNLLGHVSVEELTYLLDLFGRNKLQFLDYILGSSESQTDDPDNDESILSDIERLLHHHRETLATSQQVNENTKTLIALQKLEMLLKKLSNNKRKSDVSKATLQADGSCVGGSCSTNAKDEKEPKGIQDFAEAKDTKAQRDGRKAEERDKGQAGGVTEESREDEVWKGRQKETQAHPHIHPGSPQPQEGVMKQSLEFGRQIVTDSITYAHATREVLIGITAQVVSSLPDDLRPGPDLYGLPWEPVLISSFVGLVTMLLFTCRCYSSVKSRMYRSKERRMAEHVAQLLEEKCKVLETLSKCQQEYGELEESLRDSGVLAQTQKTEQLEIKARQVEHNKSELERDIGQLKDQLEHQREHRLEQERKIAVLEESMKTLEDEIKDLQSQEEQAQTTLKVYSMNTDRLQRNLEMAGEESTVLKESNAQLRQQAEGWAERVSELEAEMRRCEVAYSGMQQDVANKDERIMSLTDHLLRMKAWDSDLENEKSEEEEKKEASNGRAAKLEGEIGDITDTQGHLQKVQKLIYAAKLNADLKSLDEDKDRVFAKLNDEVKAKEDLQESIKEMENEKLSLQSDAEQYSDQVQRLQQKLHIMTEMYQENELKLHRLLTVEERERLQKEEKLNKADKNIALAIEEVNNYRQRAEEMEEELEKTKQSYQTQISAHEKKAHNNWLAARGAERDLADIRRENALLRQKLTDTQFKLDAIDKDPYALDSLARPLPFRAERSPYGPSPLGRPASETRPFLSPPTLMDGPPARLSPRMSHGPVEPPASQGELERSGGPHSDSGSISPTWDRDRRGPPLGPPPGPLCSIGPPGYMFPDAGGPMYRRPPPPPGAVGILPPPGSLPPGPLLPHPRGFLSGPPPGPPHSTDIVDAPYSENNTGPIEQQHRESGSGDWRTPPEADLRMGGPLPPGPPMGPMDGPFPRRPPYGPPPPDFYPPRGPGGPAMRPMWAPPPSGMMFPPRFSPSGPPLSNAPHPHYAPAMRPPAPDRLPPPSMGPPPPQQPLSFPPHRSSSEEHATSPEDAI